MDGSKTGSGGKQGDYQMETESAKWQLERNDPSEVENQVRYCRKSIFRDGRELTRC